MEGNLFANRNSQNKKNCTSEFVFAWKYKKAIKKEEEKEQDKMKKKVKEW